VYANKEDVHLEKDDGRKRPAGNSIPSPSPRSPPAIRISKIDWTGGPLEGEVIAIAGSLADGVGIAPLRFER
jgi:hypothetical protein